MPRKCFSCTRLWWMEPGHGELPSWVWVQLQSKYSTSELPLCVKQISIIKTNLQKLKPYYLTIKEDNLFCSGKCKTVYMPPETPDVCIPSINRCPETTSPELKKLCEHGVANFVRDTLTNNTYWNQFCAECNSVTLTEYEPALLPVDNGNRLYKLHKRITLSWIISMLFKFDEVLYWLPLPSVIEMCVPWYKLNWGWSAYIKDPSTLAWAYASNNAQICV